MSGRLSYSHAHSDSSVQWGKKEEKVEHATSVAENTTETTSKACTGHVDWQYSTRTFSCQLHCDSSLVLTQHKCAGVCREKEFCSSSTVYGMPTRPSVLLTGYLAVASWGCRGQTVAVLDSLLNQERHPKGLSSSRQLPCCAIRHQHSAATVCELCCSRDVDSTGAEQVLQVQQDSMHGGSMQHWPLPSITSSGAVHYPGCIAVQDVPAWVSRPPGCSWLA